MSNQEHEISSAMPETRENLQAPVSRLRSVLSIAGSDPSGGAGIQADLKTFQHFGVYGMAAISLITVQNTLGIKEVLVIHPDKIKSQISTVLEDIHPDVIKLGALGHGPAVLAVADALKDYQGPIVADPVMLSKNGAPLLMKEAIEIYKQKILQRCFLITPNLNEASQLAGFEVFDRATMEKAARVIQGLGAKNVLIKGGHLEGEVAADLIFDGVSMVWIEEKKILSNHTHGVGCTLASAISAELAKSSTLIGAIRSAKAYVSRAIQNAPQLGKGNGPLQH